MAEIKSYIYSVIVFSIIVAVICSLVDTKTSTGKLLHYVCKMILAIVIISPIKDTAWNSISNYIENMQIDSKIYTEAGIHAAKEDYASNIKSQLEAYILDKANSMGLTVAVEVELGGDEYCMPRSVKLKGDVSPYAKEILKTFIENDLGITKENQMWN